MIKERKLCNEYKEPPSSIMVLELDISQKLPPWDQTKIKNIDVVIIPFMRFRDGDKFLNYCFSLAKKRYITDILSNEDLKEVLEYLEMDEFHLPMDITLLIENELLDEFNLSEMPHLSLTRSGSLTLIEFKCDIEYIKEFYKHN